MTKEEFKAIFLSKKKLANKLRVRVTDALSELQEARRLAETLPESDWNKALEELDDLENKANDEATKGVSKPGEAWVAMGVLGKEVAQKKNDISQASQKDDKGNLASRFNRAFRATQRGIVEARKGTRAISNQGEADRLEKVLSDLSAKVTKVLKAVGTTDPTKEHCATIEEYRAETDKLLQEVRSAQGLDPQPGTQRAATKAVIAGVTGIKSIGERLNSPKKDAKGRTAMQDLQGRLELFDEQFATDPGKSPEATKRNNAMRMAAVASVTAERISDDVNDPYLRPRIGKSLIAEYAPEMKDTLAAGDDDEDDAKGAVLLAQALVMDDPITKLMGGKLDPSDAVQRIRDMAAVAGESPSVMFKLLRQQFEMKMGSLTKGEVDRAQKSNDPIKGSASTQPFKLSDITGEIDPNQFAAMLELGVVPDLGGVHRPESPEWKDDGSGLAFKPASRQMHKVEAKDTFGTLAQKYLGDEKKWEDIRKDNKIVMNPTTKKPEDLQKLDKDAALPAGLMLNVPGNMSLLDQLAPYVKAWDPEEEKKETKVEAKKDTKDAKADTKAKPKDYNKLQAKQKGAPTKITEDTLRDAFAKLRSPKDKDPAYTQVPGLGQDHAPRKPLGEDEQELHGELNPRQYSHLRMLARSDAEDREAILAREGKPVEDVIAQKISARYGKDRVNDALAKKVAKAAEVWIAKVPLTITFSAARLFSDSKKDGPTHGTKYKSEVEFSRGKTDLKDLIGRDKTVKGTVGTQGGTDTGWKEDRGDNYMRWRRDKDSREGRLDDLAYEDQQIFGAANPAFEKAKGSEQGGTAGGFGKNYYGDAHFLLSDLARNRCAFIVRAAAAKGAKVAVQRKNAAMLLYDMLSSEADSQFLDAMLSMANGKDKITVPGLKWEVHLYGGFDISKDAKEIYLSDDIDAKVSKRIEKFATSNGIGFKKIGQKPDGLEILEKQDPKQMELPAL